MVRLKSYGKIEKKNCRLKAIIQKLVLYVQLKQLYKSYGKIEKNSQTYISVSNLSRLYKS